MKSTQIITAIAIAALASVAHAAGPRVSLSYDYANANGNTPLKSNQEATLSVAQDTKFGTFDVAGVMRRVDAGIAGGDSTQGFEVGYGLQGELAGLGLKGRLAYGQANGISNRRAGALTGQNANGDYASIALEASRPITSNMTGFVGYRFRHGLDSHFADQSRAYFGTDIKLAPAVGVRIGLTHDRQNKRISNGVTTSVSYQF